MLKGVGKGLEDGLEELGKIPAKIRFDKKVLLTIVEPAVLIHSTCRERHWCSCCA